jgi:hypothetical protein
MIHSLSGVRRRPALVLGIVVATTALVWVVAQATWGEASSSASVPQQQPVQCSFFFEPEQPLELNSVATGRFVKSVAMEKEINRCTEATSRLLVRLYDVELYVEIIEQARNGTIKPVEKRVELAVCSKDVRPQRSAPRIRCRASDVPLKAFDDPFIGCGLATKQPTDPVEMNTVAVQRGGFPIPLPTGRPLIKTIKVEKELFDCDGPVVDLFLFTEIIESEVRDSVRPISKTFEAILCRKDRATLEAAPPVRCMQVPTS